MGDFFGYSVAVSGDGEVLLVGAPGKSKVYIYKPSF
ncbi:FG-GAP repeat protein [Mycetohabitans sp. B2]|nr:FG-GAP repeat protein [Mycetohabitans sp. B2]